MGVSRHCLQPTEDLVPLVEGWEEEMGLHEAEEEVVGTEGVEKMGAEEEEEQATEGVDQGTVADLTPIEGSTGTGIGGSAL